MRISHSLLAMWERGKVDEAVKLYFHLEQEQSEAVKKGRAFHEKVAEHIKKTGKIPAFLPQLELKKPEAEVKFNADYNELFSLSGIFDLLDREKKLIVDWKTGVTDAIAHTYDGQIDFYFLLSELAGVDVQEAYLVHYNEQTKKKDWIKIWKSERAIERARNRIDTLAPEIYQYFVTSGLIKAT